MENVKFLNGESFDITVNGVKSTNESLKIAIVAPEMDLVAVEEMVSNADNTGRIDLLSESGEVLKIYSGYTVLTSIEKKKDVVIATTIEGDEEVVTKSDVIYITLHKVSDTETRLSSLEETVDVLVMSALVE